MTTLGLVFFVSLAIGGLTNEMISGMYISTSEEGYKLNIKYRNQFAVISATIWISLSEFIRNEVLLKDLWVWHYSAMGLEFPSEPMNGAVWGIWSLLLALLISMLASRFSLLKTALIAWFAAFVMMWVVIGNLGVLPMGILPWAIPLSLVEVFVACWIVFRISRK